MKILELVLTNFRNHKKLKLGLDHEVVLITGPNGAGKSNVLEAISALSTGKSIKAKYDKDMISYSENFTTASANVLNSSGKYLLELQILNREGADNISIKKSKVNKVAKSLAAFSGIFNSVLFTPEDLNIITGSPSERRRYVDSVLMQTNQSYRRNLSSYVKAVRQRNKILEKISEFGTGLDEIGFWTKKILEHGKYIQSSRKDFFVYLNKELSGIVETLNGKHSSAEIKYLINEMSEEHLEKHKDTEVNAKTTLVGPHRDDFSIIHKDHNLAEFGSRGEQRSIMLALKICEIGFIEKEKRERPVLLLDDIFSELDEKHRNSVFGIMEKQQTILTCTEIPFYLSEKQKVHTINIL